jgi:molybdenum cofactor cytidylyltransferase
MLRVSAVLLAAGRSRRMGTPKALLPWHGTTLLQYQLAQLAEPDEVTEIVVVTGHRAAEIEPLVAGAAKARCVRNAAWESGKVSSILTGLRALSPDCDAVLLLAVDQPRPAAVLRALLDEHVRARPPISLPAFEGRRGHPVLFDRALLPELLAIDEATLGVRAVIARHAPDVREVPCADPAVLLDINIPADLAEGSPG